jgi:uncharacterized protein
MNSYFCINKPHMKYLLALSLLLTFSLSAEAQKRKSKVIVTQVTPADKESALKQYYFVMLVKGSRRDEITDTAKINKLQAGHMANMERLAKEGRLILAGPFMDDMNWRGIFILNCATEKEAEQLLNTDPAIAAGRLGYEIHPWATMKNCLFK